MTEPRNAIFKQFSAMLRADGVELQIDLTVFRQIAELAIEYKTGARSLRGIFEEMMTDILYAIPDNPAIKKWSSLHCLRAQTSLPPPKL